MANISKNNIITVNRGDSFKFPFMITIGDAINYFVYDLMPGDVLVNVGHIMMFVGSYGGGAGNLAQASFHIRTSYLLDIGSTYGRMGGGFADNTSGAYTVYRFVGNAGSAMEDISE